MKAHERGVALAKKRDSKPALFPPPVSFVFARATILPAVIETDYLSIYTIHKVWNGKGLASIELSENI